MNQARIVTREGAQAGWRGQRGGFGIEPGRAVGWPRWLALVCLVAIEGCSTAPPATTPEERAVVSSQASTPLSRADLESVKDQMAELQEELRTGKPAARPRSSAKSPPHEPAKERPTPSSPPASARCTSPLPPSWLTHVGRLEAVGESTVSQEDADRNARVAVVKNIEVTIQGQDVTVQQETSAAGFSYAVSSETVERVNVTVSGLDMIDRHVDPCQARFYALAKLDTAQALRAWHVDLHGLTSQRQELGHQLAEQERQGEVFRALLTASRLLEAEQASASLERRVAFLASQPVAGETGSRVEHVRARLDALLASVHFLKVSGEGQRAIQGPVLDRPLVVRLTMGDTPVRGVLVRFVVDSGEAMVEPAVRTDGQGTAQTPVRYATDTDAAVVIVARVELAEALSQYPPSLRQRVEQRSEQLSAQFRIDPPVYHQVARLRWLGAEVGAVRATATRQADAGELFPALQSWDRVRELQEAWVQEAQPLAWLPAEVRGTLSNPGPSTATRRQLERLVASIQLRKVSGDHQRAKPGQPLGQPLRVQLVSAVHGTEQPVADVPIQFGFERGRGELDPTGHTDAHGRLEVRVRRVEPDEASVVVVGRVVVEQLPLDGTAFLRQALSRHFDTQQLRFSLTPPPIAGDATPLGQALYAVALRLAANVNTSQGAPTAMQEFIENRTRRRLSVSARFEAGLSSALSRMGVLDILETTAAGPSAVKTAGGHVAPSAELRGVYEADASGGIWLTAKLIRLADGVMEATAEGTIPRSALAEDDLRELGVGQPLDQASSILVAPAPTQGFSDWVEAFWDVRNDRGFQTELVADRPQYQDGDKAVFRFKTTRDCYLTVVNIGASGGWHVLLPNKWQPEMRQTLVRASDGWVTVPDPQAPFDITVGKPLGAERVKAVCTTSPVPLIRNMKYDEAFFSLSPDTARSFRDLTVSASVVRPEEWSEAHAAVVTLERGQTETQGLRGLKMRGVITP